MVAGVVNQMWVITPDPLIAASLHSAPASTERRGNLPADTKIASSICPGASSRAGTATPGSVWVLGTDRPGLDLTQPADLVQAHGSLSHRQDQPQTTTAAARNLRGVGRGRLHR